MVLIKNVPFNGGNNPWKFRFDISKGLETVRVDGKNDDEERRQQQQQQQQQQQEEEEDPKSHS